MDRGSIRLIAEADADVRASERLARPIQVRVHQGTPKPAQGADDVSRARSSAERRGGALCSAELGSTILALACSDRLLLGEASKVETKHDEAYVLERTSAGTSRKCSQGESDDHQKC